MAGGRPVGYLQSVQELNLGPPNINLSCGMEEDLNPGPPDCKSSLLISKSRRLPRLCTIICLAISNFLDSFKVVQRIVPFFQRKWADSCDSFFFYKNVVFPAQAEYSYFSADFRLRIFL